MRVIKVHRYKYALVRSGLLVLVLIIASLVVFATGVTDAYINHAKKSRSKLTISSSQNNTTAIDLIENQHWQMAGVTMIPKSQLNNSKLEVSSTNLAIVNQDGSSGQNNPPVNLYGTRLQVSGDFSVSFKLSEVNQEIGLSLYGTPPLIEDELRAEYGTLDLDLSGNLLKIKISDQKGGFLAAKQDINITATTNPTITITDQSGKLSFKINDQIIGTAMNDRSIFKTGKVWLGMDARSPGSKFTVDQLTATGLNSGVVTTVNIQDDTVTPDPNGFASLAQNKRTGFIIGSAVAPGPMVNDDIYRGLLGNYNSFTTENAGKFETIHPLSGDQPQDYNFSEMDGIVSMAKKSSKQVHGHALVFGESNPSWVQEIAKNDPSQLEQIMVSHIKTVMEHYKGQVASWDVVNEPLADYDTEPGQYGLRKHIWYNAIGPNYIAIALRAAHQADPDAKLWINEFGMESDDDRFATMLDLVKQLKDQGIPLTGIGFQAHIDDSDTDGNDAHIDTNKLSSRMKALNQLGVSVRISELDITNESEYPVFSDAIKVCMQESNCEGVTMWGITDKYSSSGELSSKGIYSSGFGLPWDEDLRPSLAVDIIKTAL